ncbi:uncharacterized protein K444DRAFT_612582 [Hyaloscypha bicolor E]|uniref:Uncharacterized protein n=1 Tax=Hyaloscypha bicolor E TaxID=1095630 RepID=A0A2J6TBL3_9HELO|nr:uncharacterized protein K444DRAFT_612582 [Hyaloscypha bicolor E]PMD60415.1 hypothetical protein K444DRAFT_612582 [Hyaloscypha bicolor E]
MDALASLNSKLARIFVPIGVSDAQFPTYGLPPSTALVWRCIGDLVSRPWFRRLWVL